MDISDFLKHEIEQASDLTHLMRMVEDICKEERTLVILDELPYLLESAPQASSVIQKSIDRVLKNLDCMFVICGSSISVMRNETENSSKPLYGRFENTLRVGPLSIEACKEFHPNMDVETALRWYCTVGGIPMYHKVPDNIPYEEILKDKFLGYYSAWRNDGPQTILQEFNGNTDYTGAVKCIADGSVKQSEIAEKMKIDRAAAKRILDNLEFVGIIERRNPMAGAPKKPVYRIKDPFIAFHYCLLCGRMKLIERSSDSDKVYDMINNNVKSHLEHMFEVFCGEWLDNHYPVIQRGQWWGVSEGEYVDIDIVAKIPDDDKYIHTIVGECKFSKKPMGFGPYNTLMSRTKDAGIDENINVMLFSASGFEEDISEYAKENKISLVDGDILIGNEPSPKLFH